MTDRRGWQTITLGTHNIGRAKMAEVAQVAAECDALALQEASDANRIVLRKHLERFDLRLLDHDAGVGAPATPLIYDPATLRFEAKVVRLLLPSRWVGVGAGPSRSKPKWFVGGRFLHRPTGRQIVYGSVHNLASQWNPIRRRYATELNQHLARLLEDRKAITAVGGDFNIKPSGPSTAPLRKAGFRCNQTAAAREIKTHGSWGPPDQVWWQPDERIRFGGHRAIRTGSDHDALLVELEIKERNR